MLAKIISYVLSSCKVHKTDLSKKKKKKKKERVQADVSRLIFDIFRKIHHFLYFYLLSCLFICNWFYHLDFTERRGANGIKVFILSDRHVFDLSFQFSSNSSGRFSFHSVKQKTVLTSICTVGRTPTYPTDGLRHCHINKDLCPSTVFYHNGIKLVSWIHHC